MIGAIIRMSGAELKSAKPQNDIPSIDCCDINSFLIIKCNLDSKKEFKGLLCNSLVGTQYRFNHNVLKVKLF